MQVQKSISLGNSTADSFLLLDDESVGRIVRALVYFKMQHKVPAVPKQLRGTFFAAYAEDCRIRKVKPMSPQLIRFAETAEEAQADVAEIAEIPDVADIAAEEEEKRIEEIHPDDPDDARARAIGPIGPSDHRSSVDFPSRFSSDPVEDAMKVCASEKKGDLRCFGSYLKKLGCADFMDVVQLFQSEINAGEIPENRSACLVAKFKARESMLRAMA